MDTVLICGPRDRRKKCDEKRPSCRRCEAAGRACEGYRSATAASLHATENAKHLARSISYGAPHTRYSWYGLVTLTDEVAQNEFGIDAALWATLVSKCYRVSPAVHAAVSCLGATYERFSGEKLIDQAILDSNIKQLYALSLRRLQEEIEAQTDGPLPLFFASVILAGVEVLQNNAINALTHIQGAFKVYAQCIPGSSPSSVSPKADFLQGEEQHAVASIVQALDIQTASFALARPLDLPPFSTAAIPHGCGSAPLCTEQMRSQILSLLHNCYHFAIQASSYKYVHYSHMPPDITIDQGRHISLLLSWLSVLKDFEKQGPEPVEARLGARQRCILSLRAQCLSSIIYLSTILCPYETSYDAFLGFFDEIVQIAFLLLFRDGIFAKGGSKRRFRMLSSLSQPLFFTAMKCRDPRIRRKAAALLDMTGKEGPWDAQILVVVVSAAIALEEGAVVQQLQMPAPDLRCEEVPARKNLSILVPAQSRLHGCGMGNISADGFNSAQQAVKRAITVRFSRCVDVDKMVRSTEGDDPRAFEDERHWDIWHQDIKI